RTRDSATARVRGGGPRHGGAGAAGAASGVPGAAHSAGRAGLVGPVGGVDRGCGRAAAGGRAGRLYPLAVSLAAIGGQPAWTGAGVALAAAHRGPETAVRVRLPGRRLPPGTGLAGGRARGGAVVSDAALVWHRHRPDRPGPGGAGGADRA